MVFDFHKIKSCPEFKTFWMRGKYPYGKTYKSREEAIKKAEEIFINKFPQNDKQHISYSPLILWTPLFIRYKIYGKR